MKNPSIGANLTALSAVLVLDLLIVLIILYCAGGSPRGPTDPSVPTPSTVGVLNRALFVAAGSTIAVVLLAAVVLLLAALPPNGNAAWRAPSLLVGASAAVASASLILLVALDSGATPAVHTVFAVIFFITLATTLGGLQLLLPHTLGLAAWRWRRCAEAALAAAVVLAISSGILNLACSSGSSCDSASSVTEWLSLAAYAASAAALAVSQLRGGRSDDAAAVAASAGAGLGAGASGGGDPRAVAPGLPPSRAH